MDTWSYKIVTVKSAHSVEDQLNEDGKEGWEAFKVEFHQYDNSTTLYYRKRAVGSAAS